VGLNPPKDLKPRHLVGVFYWILFSNLIFVYLLYMKKVTFILAFGAMLALTACGSGSTATETTDSTVSTVDTTVVPVSDSTSVPVQGGAGGGVVDENGKSDSHSAVEEIK
jgi:hypothetical protein